MREEGGFRKHEGSGSRILKENKCRSKTTRDVGDGRRKRL